MLMAPGLLLAPVLARRHLILSPAFAIAQDCQCFAAGSFAADSRVCSDYNRRKERWVCSRIRQNSGELKGVPEFLRIRLYSSLLARLLAALQVLQNALGRLRPPAQIAAMHDAGRIEHHEFRRGFDRIAKLQPIAGKDGE